MLKKILKNSEVIRSSFERLSGSQISHIGNSKQAIEQWLSKLENVPPAKGKVLITALRNNTWIEWAAYCSAVIRQMGFESTLLYNEGEIVKLYKSPLLRKFWSSLNRIPGLKLVNLETLAYDEHNYHHYLSQNESACIAALAYDYHIESAEIVDHPEKYGKELLSLKDKSAKNGARLFKYCKGSKFHIFLCYSGIIHDTSMLLQGAIDAGQETVCVEGWAWRPGHMIYNFNAPALEYNVRGWMNYLSKFEKNKDTDIKKYFDFLDGAEPENEWLNNFYNVQKTKIAKDLPSNIKNFIQGKEKIFLLASNVIGDSSMMNRETIFRSHKEFLEQTTTYFMDNPNLKLIIRAHPGESWVKSKVVVRMGKLAKEIAKGIPNILVIDSDEKVNTFSLLPFLQAGLVWISSAGADITARGVPVIAAARPKYSDLGFVSEPKNKNEYFDLIKFHSENNLRPSKEQIQSAKDYLYLVFKGFSFEAYGRNFRADTCILNNMPTQEEHDRFYKIILKLETAPDQLIN